ncbi:hypothetical protein ABIB80_004559 [Bradyrhizobium sp. i1.15.2]
MRIKILLQAIASSSFAIADPVWRGCQQGSPSFVKTTPLRILAASSALHLARPSDVLRCATLIRYRSGYASYCGRGHGTSAFARPDRVVAGARRPILNASTFSGCRSAPSKVGPQSRATFRPPPNALALRCMPGLLLRLAFAHSADALPPRTCAIKEQPSSCGIPKTDVAMREQRLRAHNAISTGLP